MRSFTKPSTRTAQRFRPSLETLESRWCPSAAGIVQTGATLTIQGDGANDAIVVRDNGQGGVTASITLASGTQTFTGTGISAIDINAGGGNDTIDYALTGALRETESLMLCLGKGNNQVGVNDAAGLLNAVLAISVDGAGHNKITTQFGAVTGSRLNLSECFGAGGATSHVNFAGLLSSSLVTVQVSSGLGNAHVFAQVGNVSSSNLQFVTHLGKGANSFALTAAGNLQNAVVHFNIDAGCGSNTITFGTVGVNVDTTSRLNLDTCTGTGNDTVNMTYAGVMDGELDLNLQGGKSNDTMDAVLTLEQGSTGRVWGREQGGNGTNMMTFDIYDDSNPGGKSTLALLNAILNGGTGTDDLSATRNVKVIV